MKTSKNKRFKNLLSQFKYEKIILIVLILIIISVGYWLISPLFIDKKVTEKMSDIKSIDHASSPQVIAQGIFSGLGGHSAEGSAKLFKIGDKYFIRFEDNFRVTNGPDLFVHFGKDGHYDASTRIAELKGNIGGQNYKIPANLNPANYNEIWVWCRSFSVAFGKAILK